MVSMWIMSTLGFYSVAVEDGDAERVVVRARRAVDLSNLLLAMKLRRRIVEQGTDYPYRVRMSRKELEEMMVVLADQVQYGNFKDAVAKSLGQSDKVPLYARVWLTLRELGAQPIPGRW